MAEEFAKIKVLYVFAALPVGGAEELLVTEVEGLNKGLFAPMVCVLSEKGPVGAQIERMGVPVIALQRMKKKQFDYRIIRDLCRVMRAERVQVVHTHLYDGGKYGRIAAWLTGVPCVIATYHNVYVRRRIKYHLVNRTLAAVTDRMIAVSGAVRESVMHYDRIAPGKIQVLYNGIDPSRFAGPFDRQAVRLRFGVTPEETLMGVIARLEEQKGHIYLLQALSRVMPKNKALKILFAGEGKLKGFLQARAQEMGLAANVIFAGTQKPIAPVLSALDLFLLPSLWEGFSIAILEAMVMGLPVMATSVGGAAEVIAADRDGVLLPPGDAQSLASSIEDFLGHRDRYVQMGRRGRQKILRDFTKARHIDLLQSLYLEILGQKEIRPAERAP